MPNEVKLVIQSADIITDLGAIDYTYAECIVYDDQKRTSGNVFVWKNTSGNANGGTIYTGATGEWWMQFDESYVDVKWFGCKGDDATNDTVNFQNALNFIASQVAIGESKISIFIFRGDVIVYFLQQVQLLRMYCS